MSFESDAMDFVLGLLTDSGIYTTKTQRRNFTPHDKISSSEIPFVQAFDPLTTSAPLTFGEQQATLTFMIQIMDVKGKSDDLRKAMDDLWKALRRDPTIGGTVQSISLVLSTIQEIASDERSVVQASIEVTRQSGAIDDAIDLIDFAGKASDVTVDSVGDTVENSAVIPGGLGYTHLAAASSFPFYTMSDPAFTELPIDFTLTPIVRVLHYIQPSADGVVGQTRISFISRLSGLIASTFFDLNGARIGWQQQVVDIVNDTPDQTFGGGVDFSNIVAIRMQYSYSANNTLPDVILKRIFHYPRDTGSSGFSRAF